MAKMIKKNYKRIGLLAMSGFVMMTVLVFIFINTSSSYTLSSDAYQIISGEKKVYKAGTSFVYKEEGVSYKGAKKNEYISSSPIYINEKTILLPGDSIYVDARQVIFSKLEGLNEVVNENQMKYKSSYINGGFIYDGKKTYTFLEPITLTINGVERQLSALSSVSVSSNQMYCLYDASSKTISIDKIYTKSLLAINSEYQIDLLNDILFDKDHKKILLVNRVDQLEEYK